MYNAVYRNGYLLPPKRDPWLTYEFLDGVRNGTFWLPKTSECKMYSCLDPPPREELAEIVKKAIIEHANKYDYAEKLKYAMISTAMRLEKNPPQKDF